MCVHQHCEKHSGFLFWDGSRSGKGEEAEGESDFSGACLLHVNYQIVAQGLALQWGFPLVQLDQEARSPCSPWPACFLGFDLYSLHLRITGAVPLGLIGDFIFWQANVRPIAGD